jgi:hypothetical protein
VKSVATAILVGGLLTATASSIDADIEGTTFSSKTAHVRMTLPRGWRWSDQATYPGLILRMNRTRPRATMMLAVDPLPTEIDPSCRDRPPAAEGAPSLPFPIEVQVACQQGLRLTELGFTVGVVKEGARPWFDYAYKERQLRQGVFVAGEDVFTLVLAAETAASRAQYARTFDKALRSLRTLRTAPVIDEETGEEISDGGVPIEEAPLDGGVAP